MIARPALVGLLCLTFLAPRALGLHWHGSIEQERSHGAGASGHHTPVHAALAVELTPSHLQAHFADGEFDVQIETSSPSKTPAVNLFVALLALAFVVLVLLKGRRIAWPPLRPPRPRLQTRFLPPSHAPPNVA